MFRRQSVALTLAVVLLLAVGASPTFAAPIDRPANSIVGNVLAWVTQIGDYLGFRGIDREQDQYAGSGVESAREASTDECGITVDPGG